MSAKNVRSEELKWRGIVARLEEALGPLRASVGESLDGVARRLLREAKNLRAERDELIEKRHVEIERAERLKAENASLEEKLKLEQLRHSDVAAHWLGEKNKDIEALRAAKAENASLRDDLQTMHSRAAHLHCKYVECDVAADGMELLRLQSANASLLESLRETRVALGDTEIARRAAEQRNTALEGALRDLFSIIRSDPDMSGVERLMFLGSPASRTAAMRKARAALHDEERPQPMSAEELMAEMKKAKPSTRPPPAAAAQGEEK